MPVEQYDALAALNERVLQLEEVVEERDKTLESYIDFEGEMKALAADRQRMLDRLGMTEHEWACSGGKRFGDFTKPSEKKLEEKSTSSQPASPPDDLPPPPPEWVGWPVTWCGTDRATFESVWSGRFGPLNTNDALEIFGEYVLMSASCALLMRYGEYQMLEPLPPAPFPAPPPPPPPPPVAESPSPLSKVDINWLLKKTAFPPVPTAPRIEWTDEQRAALDEVDAWYSGYNDRGAGAFFALTGPAGTGKSTLIREIVSRYARRSDYDDSMDVALTAMTGKAALRLQQCAGADATTLHKILYWPPKPGEETKFTRLREAPARFVVVDEASMLGPTIYSDMQQWARYGVRFLLVGDDYQLPPVITGDELKQHGEDYSIFRFVKGAHLQTVMRSVGGVLRAATRIREIGDVVTESDFDGEEGYEFRWSKNPVADAVESYLADQDDHMCLTWRNDTRMQANKAIRACLGHDGELPDEGEPVLIKKNGQGRLNGEVVRCGQFEAGPIVGSIQTMWMTIDGGLGRVLVSVDGGRDGEFFDGGTPWVENWKKYHIDLNKQCLPEPIPITWGYVLTAHSGQGSEARRVTVFLTRGDVRNTHFRKSTTLPSGERVSMAARWCYTAATRSKFRTTMLVGR
jgi:hypothetical protein